jgi:hypothetical protein
MSKVSHLPKIIPSKEIPFKIKTSGAVTGHTYEGEFVVKVPSVREMSRIGLELARLNDGIPFEMLDKSTAALNNALAFLRITLTEAPKWFVNDSTDLKEEGMAYGLDTLDVNVPMEVFRVADKKVRAWHEALQGQPNESTT